MITGLWHDRLEESPIPFILTFHGASIRAIQNLCRGAGCRDHSLLTLSLDRLQADFGAPLGRFWTAFGPTLDQLWARFGPTLDRLWVDFGPTLGRSWAEPGPIQNRSVETLNYQLSTGNKIDVAICQAPSVLVRAVLVVS